MRAVRVALLGALLTASAPAMGASSLDGVRRATALDKLSGAVPLQFMQRQHASLLVELRARPSAADLSALLGVGARLPFNATLGHGRYLALRANVDALTKLSAMPQVVSIRAGGPPIATPPPLNATAAEIGATATWLRLDDQQRSLTGQGITVCNIDAGVDVFHPLFFRADGGYHEWHDVDGDGAVTAGVDQVVIDGQAITLAVLQGHIFDSSADVPILGSADPNFNAGMDWLYADANGNGSREFGRDAGFDDSTPSFGEQLFAVDDVNDNGTLDVGEKLVALGSSKIRAVAHEETVYGRGRDLIDAPLGRLPNHGSAAASVMMGGARGLTRLTGIAPDAELIAAIRTTSSAAELYALASYCMDQGARVVLHEYAPWLGYYLDGSSPLEQLIDKTAAAGVAHINPAGNLSTSDKLYKHEHPAGQTTTIDVTVPTDEEYHYFGASVLWRGGRNLQFTLVDGSGETRAVQPNDGDTFEPWHGELDLFTERGTSERGTSRVDIFVFGDDFAVPVDAGDWEIRVTDPQQPSATPVEVIAYVQDDVSGWDKGIHFPEHVSEDHLIGYPGTADLGLVVAAYSHNAFNNSLSAGERVWYSGRGYRIDGEEILSVTAPADPITAGWFDGKGPSYRAFSGTSGASPHVAGAAALAFQAHPDWTGEQVRSALRDGALVDDAVGDAPNHDYGWGKLRIHRSLFGEAPKANEPPTIEGIAQYVFIEQTVDVVVQVSDPDQSAATLRIEVDRDYDGSYDETFVGQSYQVRFDTPGEHVHKLRVVDANGAETTTLARYRVRTARDWVAVGGCALGKGRDRNAGWLLVALALLSLRSWRKQPTTSPRSLQRQRRQRRRRRRRRRRRPTTRRS